MRRIGTALLCVAALGLGGLAGCTEGSGDPAETSGAASADARCPHEIKVASCPFCTPELIESEGFCGAHGCPEALCARCRPFLKVAFRAKGDWCSEHALPESQCVECNPELAEKVRPGEHGVAMPTSGGDAKNDADASTCEHGIAEARCPFCTPSLLESEGFCGGHDVPEALCVKCRPFLKTAFVAKGDWCAPHDTPESQCKICNP